MTQGSPDTSSSLPSTDAPASPSHRPGRKLRLVLGVATALSVVVIVLLAAAGALFVSGVIPLSGLQAQVSGDLQRRLGEGWSVTARDAAILRVDGRPVLKVSQAQFEHSSGLRLRAPDASVRYDPWSLFRGQVRIKSIDIHGVALRLQVDEQGALTLDTGEGRLSIPAEAQSEEGPNAVERISRVLGGLLDNDSLLPGLDRIALTGSTVRLVGPNGTERNALDNADIHLERTAQGRQLRLSGMSATGSKDIVIASRPEAGGGRRIDVVVNAFRLDTAERLFVGPSAAISTGFALSGQFSLRARLPGQEAVTGTLRIGPGKLSSPDGGDETIGLDQLTASFSADAALQRMLVSDIRATSGATALTLSGEVTRTPSNAWTITGKASGTVGGEGQDPPLQLTRAELNLTGEALERATLNSLVLEGPKLRLTGSGRAARTAEGPEVAVRLDAAQSQARALLASWPAIISPIIRKVLAERIVAGDVDAMTLVMDMPPPALRAARAGDPTPDEAVRVTASGRNLRFVIGPGIPHLEELSLSALATGRTLSVTNAAGRAEIGKGRVLSLSEGSFAIADTWSPRPIGRAAFRSTGPVDALAALLALPAFREAAPGQIEPDSIKGRVDLRNSVSLPLVDNIKPTDVIVQASGSITALSADGLMGREKLEGGSLAVNYERGALSLKGEGRVGGTPAQIEIRQDAKGLGEAVVTMTLDQAARQRRGFALNNTVTGPVGLRVVKPLGRKPDAYPRFEVDLARAAIDGLLPGWTKPAGRPGRVSFTLVDKGDDELDFNDLVIDSAPVSIRGKLSLGESGAMQAGTFSQVKLSPGDDMRVEMRREGAVHKLTIRGQVADARPFLKPLTSNGPPPKSGEPPADLDIDMALPILTGFNSEAIGNASLKLSVRAREVRQLEFSGRLGRAPIAVLHSRDGEGRRIRVTSEDGGGLLRFIDLYRRAFGGDLVIDARPTGDTMIGDISLRNFRVQGEPALRRVLGEQVPVQGEAARTQRSADVGGNVQFQRLKATFLRSPSRFELRDGVIWGNQIGFTGQGSLDYGRDRVDIAGTFVPGYLLNNAFAQVPLIGPLLGGGQYEGLFAVNFRISGPASQPSMTINPLSALAPGILRRFVDPFGGVPVGQGAASP